MRIVLPPEETALEDAADALLRQAPKDPERPSYTERQLARRAYRTVSIERLVETAALPPQSLRDELRFLASVSRMGRETRRYLRLWLDGWAQSEIAEGCKVTVQNVSRMLRRALRICYDAEPLSFRQFSHHTVYKKRRARGPMIVRRCVHCEEEFSLEAGQGRYCSDRCRRAARRARRNSKKNGD